VVVIYVDGGESVHSCRPGDLDDWRLYRPTPPVPTPEECRELWEMLDALRDFMPQCKPHQYGHGPLLDALVAIDAMKAKVTQ
jgi:hypothetical protein